MLYLVSVFVTGGCFCSVRGEGYFMSEGSDLVIVCRWLCGPEMCGGNNSGVAALSFCTHWLKLVRQFQFGIGIWNTIV